MTLSDIRRLAKSCAPLAAGLLAAGASAAQPMQPGQPTRSDVRQACQADIQKFCADVQPGGGQISKCMKAHYGELSGDCKAAIAKRRAEHRAAPPPGTASPDR